MKKVWTIVVVVIVLAIVGYFGYRTYHHYAKTVAMTQTATPTQAAKPSMGKQNNTYKMMDNPKLGSIMTDTKGMTLYTFAKDTTGVSNCSGKCLQIWPPYSAQSQTGTFPANISVIKRSDGTLQYAWKGMPLYYYAQDKKAGDATGNGFGGLWAVVK